MSQPIKPRSSQFYETREGKKPYLEWWSKIKDAKARSILLKRILKAEKGNFGTSKGLGGGLQELKEYYGPGYRIYIGIDENSLVVILLGGTKSSQNEDIKIAKKYWSNYKTMKKEG